MKFPWIKKFFGGEEEEKQIKEQEKGGMNRRHFLFIMPGIVALPEIIKDISTRDVMHITEVAKWPTADVGMDSLSAITMRWPEGMHIRTTEPIGAKGYLFGREHILSEGKDGPVKRAERLIELANEDPEKYLWLPDKEPPFKA